MGVSWNWRNTQNQPEHVQIEPEQSDGQRIKEELVLSSNEDKMLLLSPDGRRVARESHSVRQHQTRLQKTRSRLVGELTATASVR